MLGYAYVTKLQSFHLAKEGAGNKCSLWCDRHNPFDAKTECFYLLIRHKYKQFERIFYNITRHIYL